MDAEIMNKIIGWHLIKYCRVEHILYTAMIQKYVDVCNTLHWIMVLSHTVYLTPGNRISLAVHSSSHSAFVIPRAITWPRCAAGLPEPQSACAPGHTHIAFRLLPLHFKYCFVRLTLQHVSSIPQQAYSCVPMRRDWLPLIDHLLSEDWLWCFCPKQREHKAQSLYAHSAFHTESHSFTNSHLIHPEQYHLGS